MKRFPLFLVATTLLVAVSAPAQRGSRGERNVRGGVVTARHVGSHVTSQRSPLARQAPQRTTRSDVRVGSANGEGRRGSRGNVRGNVRSNVRGELRQGSRTAPGVRVGIGSRVRAQQVGSHVGYTHGTRSIRGHGRSHGHARIFRRGHGWGYWQTVQDRVLVERGHWHRQPVPAVYGWLYDSCGHRYWGVVQAACFERVWCPPRYENRSRRVWVRC